MKPKSLIILSFLALTVLSYVYFAIEKPAKQKELGAGKEDLLAPGNLTSVQSFKVVTGGKNLMLQREKLGWRMLEPTKDLASQSKVESLISALEKFKKSRVLFTPQQLETEKPDLILLDINMPIMDGWEFMNEFIKIKSQLPSVIPIYLTTSSLDASDIDKAKTYWTLWKENNDV